MNIRRSGYRSTRICLLFIFMYMFIFGSSPVAAARMGTSRTIHEGEVAPVRKMDIIPAGFHVSGRYLLDAHENNFIIRGINHPHAWYLSQTSSFANIKATRANTIRVVLSGGRWGANSATDVANVIQLCRTSRLICVLENHDTTGYGQDSAATSLAQAVSYWQSIQSVLTGQEAYVIINIGNEPYGNNNAGDWVEATRSAIIAMRNAGFNHTLMVDAPNWGQDWQFYMRDNAASLFNSDVDHNTIFSIHMYGVFDTTAKVQSYVSSFVTAGLPLVIGEFGDDMDEVIIQIAENNGIGYLGWSWSGNNSDVADLDMVFNFDPNQFTPHGNRIINGDYGIRRTSCEASVYDNIQDPKVCCILRSDPNPTSANDVSFSVKFSEPVTGFDTHDFILATTGLTGATVTSISSYNESYYKVNVNVGPGAGTVRLDIPGDATITDLDMNPLTNLPFTSGEVYTIASMWYLRGIGSFAYGTETDTTVPADYNGDGKAEIAIFRSSTSTWYVRGIGSSVYGIVGDIPVVADYNGDGRDDIAVFRPTNSTWYIRGIGSFVYGTVGDIPVVADYTGDGKADIAVFRPTNSTWYIYGVGPRVYGTVGDIPVVDDYTGDGKADVAVFRPTNSTWYIYGVGPSVYGAAGDIPVVADYTGDGKADIAVFRPSTSTWYVRGIGPSVYGTMGDIPVVADYNGDGKVDIAVFRP